MINEINQLEISFETMESTGAVNLDASLPVINRIMSNLKSLRESKAKKSENVHEAFEFYYPSFVSSIVLGSMIERLKLAKLNKDNPAVAKDSLKVLPQIKEIILGLETSGNNIDLLNLSSDLQKSAVTNNLFNEKLINKKGLNDTFKGIFQEIEL